MPTYEVFLKNDGREEYRHAGALDAANEELAIVLARECYVRRGEGDRMWLVERTNVIDPDAEFLAANADKAHRHHSGEAVAARRRTTRTAPVPIPGDDPAELADLGVDSKTDGRAE